MPYALLIIGSILFVSGVRGTNGPLWQLVKGDFTGQDSFLTWLAVIAVVGGMGYIPKLKGLSVAFMTLLLIVLFVSNNGVIQKLQSFVQNPVAVPPNPSVGVQTNSPSVANTQAEIPSPGNASPTVQTPSIWSEIGNAFPNAGGNIFSQIGGELP